jgi:hypothetical protein
MSGKRYAIEYRGDDNLRNILWLSEDCSLGDAIEFFDFYSSKTEARIISVDTDGTERFERPATKQPQD